MSETPAEPGNVRRVAAVLLLLCAASGCGRMYTAPGAAAVFIGEVGRIIRVDSEHGALNGVVGPEIVYDLYLKVPGADPDGYQLWVTRDTPVYKQQGGGLRQVPFDTLRGGEEVQVHVSEIDRQGYRPGAYALRIVILK